MSDILKVLCPVIGCWGNSKFQSEDVVFRGSYRFVTFVLFSYLVRGRVRNVGGLSLSPELFRYVVDRCAVVRQL